MVAYHQQPSPSLCGQVGQGFTSSFTCVCIHMETNPHVYMYIYSSLPPFQGRHFLGVVSLPLPVFCSAPLPPLYLLFCVWSLAPGAGLPNMGPGLLGHSQTSGELLAVLVRDNRCHQDSRNRPHYLSASSQSTRPLLEAETWPVPGGSREVSPEWPLLRTWPLSPEAGGQPMPKLPFLLQPDLQVALTS